MSVLSVLRIPNLVATAQLIRDLRAVLRVHFLHAAFELGALRALRTSATAADVARAAGATRADFVEQLLALGVALGELRKDGDRFALRGTRARALAAEDGDALAGWLQENVAYHSDVYRRFADYARGAPLGKYLDSAGQLVARSSRLLEPLLAGFAREVATTGEPKSLLEVGCGSGVYLHHAAQAAPALSGLGIDLQPEVVAETRKNLARWGLEGRFRVLQADVRSPPPELAGPWDLVTLYNNIYYFPEADRPALFQRLRGWLRPGGRLALVSAFRGDTPEMISFDLVLRATEGCTPLPELRTTEAQLRQAGFRDVRSTSLGTAELFGIVATARP